MKRIFLSIALLFSIGAYAQAQSGFGIRGGLNLAQEFSRTDDMTAITKIAPHYHLTAYYDAQIKPTFSIQSGLSLERKGGAYEEDGRKYTDKFLYLQLPVNFLGRIPTRKGDFFIGGGFYLAYGISAKLSSGGVSVDLEMGEQENQIKPFDAGLGTLAGFRLNNGLVFHLASAAGFVNMSNQSQSKFFNRTSSIGIGYEFNKR